MKFSETFSGRFLKAADLSTGHRRVTIEAIEREPVGWPAEDKLVAYFKELKKGLILNKTNADVLTEAFGDDTADCAGRIVHLVVRDVEFKGEHVPAVRIVLPAAESRPLTPAPTESRRDTPVPQSTDDDIPF